MRGHDDGTDYARAPLGRSILLLALPMALEMSMESVFAVADLWFVGRLGDAAIATVGLTESLLTIVYALGIGLAMGVTSLVARRVGAGDRPGACRAAAQGVRLGWTLGIGLGVPAAIFAPDLLRAMGAGAEVVAQGSGYARVVLGSQVVVILLFVHNAVFRGAGDAARAMQALWLANGVNLVLDPCLIFGLGPFPALGLTGAGVATAIGRGVGILLQVRLLFGGRTRIALRAASLRFDLAETRAVLRVSAGAVAQFLIATASWVVLMRIVAPFGTAALAGYTHRDPHRDVRAAAVVGRVERGRNAGRPEPRRGRWCTGDARGVDHRGGQHGGARARHGAVPRLRAGARRAVRGRPGGARRGERRAAHPQLRLPRLRLGHGRRAGLQRRRRHDDADLDQPVRLLGLPDPARRRARSRSRARGARRVLGGRDRRVLHRGGGRRRVAPATLGESRPGGRARRRPDPAGGGDRRPSRVCRSVLNPAVWRRGS
ncbi:MAG: MATE family efflux transporter [Planctomycetes bacterium]|nr:MATE family efflux transporter [Planctomycetota bacterium]